MILLITSCTRADECATLLQRSLGERAQVANSLARASAMNSAKQFQDGFAVIVLDETLLEAHSRQAEEFLEQTGAAIPLIVNLAISSSTRLVQEVRAAVRRHHQQKQNSLRAAQSLLSSELKGTLTGILLSSELALAVPKLPPEAEAKIRSVHTLARELRSRLERGT